MVAQQSGKILSAAKEAFSSSINPRKIPEAPRTFPTGKFPTGIRYLYLKSKFDQNRVSSIGYRYITPNIVEYQLAQCRSDKKKQETIAFTTWERFEKAESLGKEPVRDIFSRKIARSIINGRFEAHQPKTMAVESKNQLYNRFIYVYHPDRCERKKARQELLKEVFMKGDKEGNK